MTNLTPLSSFDDVIQHETTTLVLGGLGGPMNTQAQQLLNRTEFLNDARAALSDTADPAKGAAVIGRSGQVVDSINELRGLLKTSVSTHAFVTGYDTAGDGGGGPYYLDAADIVSADTGGDIIVATDGGRWKLGINGSLDVRQFGAKADDGAGSGTDSFAAIQAALNRAVVLKIGEVYAPGKYKILDTLVMDTGVFTQSIVLRGDGATSQIRQAGVGKDAIVFSRNQVLRNSGLKDISLYCEAIAGHGVNIEYSCTVCFFTNVNVTVLNTSKSLYVGIWSGFAVGARGCFDTVWEGGDYYITPGHTAHGFDFVTNGTTFNENCFRNLRVSQSGLVQMFRIINTHNASYLTNNRFENINFEICAGGGILAYNAKNWKLENLSFWDTPTYNNHLIHFAPNSGLESTGNTLENISRNGDVLAVGVRDIFTEAAQNTVAINCFTDPSATPSYDWNHKLVTVVGPTMTGELRTANRVYANPQNLVSASATFAGATGSATQADNFASIVRTSTGLYRLTFIIPKANTNYRVSPAISSATQGTVQFSKDVAFVDILCKDLAAAVFDPATVDVTIFG